MIGEYGAGKTFFLNLIRLIGLERKLVTVHADLAPDRRIHATGGQARSLYAEAVRNMATRTKPDGGALASVVERFVTDAVKEAQQAGAAVESVIDQRLAALQDEVGGYDYAVVLKSYWRGSEDGDEARKAAALRWLRGEYSTRTEARQALGVRTIIDDRHRLRCLEVARGFRAVGRIWRPVRRVRRARQPVQAPERASRATRTSSRSCAFLNDVLQGNVRGLGFALGGTPEFLLDTRRGLYSYQALQSRLAENAFAKGGLIDLSGPVVRLQNLTPEDMLILLTNIRTVFASGDPARHLVPDEALASFMEHCNGRIGEAYFRTPRNTIRAFVQLLAVLEQNPGIDWRTLLGEVEVGADAAGDPDGSDIDAASTTGADDELVSFRL